MWLVVEFVPGERPRTIGTYSGPAEANARADALLAASNAYHLESYSVEVMAVR